jgi:hypothetical protein
MAESPAAEQRLNILEKNENPFLGRFMSVGISIIALMEIGASWRSFSWVNKFGAVIFFSMLVGSVVSEFGGAKKGFTFLARNPVSHGGYILTLLAMLLFGSHWRS